MTLIDNLVHNDALCIVRKNIPSLFFSGNYRDLIHLKTSSTKLVKYFVGSLVFLGRDIEARALYTDSRFSKSDRVETLFYLLLSSVRRGNYSEMKDSFFSLVKSCKAKSEKKSKEHFKINKFYLFQSLALIRYYLGEFEKSCYYSQKSYQIGLKLKKDYLCMLSTDLMGHGLCMVERYSEGKRMFNLCQEYAVKIKNNNNLNLVKLAQMYFEIESGHNLIAASKSLKKWIKSIKPQDVHAKNNALLLLVKLHINNGQLFQAHLVLEEISKTVFSFNHRRQILNYNYQYCFLSILKGENSAALNLIKNSYQHCLEGQDYFYIQRFRELEQHLSTLEGRKVEKGIYSLEYLVKKTGRASKYFTQTEMKPSENFVQKRLDAISDLPVKKGDVLKLKSQGMLGVLLMTGKFPLTNFVDFSFGKHEVLFYIDSQIHYVNKLSNGQYEMLKFLVQKKLWTKKDFFEIYWRVPYDNYVHDNKIYVSLKRLSHKLGCDLKLFFFEKGDIHVCDVIKMGLQKIELNNNIIKNIAELEDLNHRQVTFLENLQKGQITLPQDYANLHQISRNTASRDLQKLTKLNKLKCFGKKRGTYYVVC